MAKQMSVRLGGLSHSPFLKFYFAFIYGCTGSLLLPELFSRGEPGLLCLVG